MNIQYYILFAFLWIYSRIPLRVLYVISSMNYVLIYYVFQYRKKVVFNNLHNAFPEKSNQEITQIAKKFYKHFSDLLVEVLKTVYYKPRHLAKRVKYRNPEVLEEIYQSKRHVIAVLGHYGNWEWLSGLDAHSSFHGMTAYKPMKNKVIDNYFKSLREKFKIDIVPMRRVIKAIKKYIEDDNYTISAFIADQSPVADEIQYWTTFLHQDTPWYLGVEKIAVKYNIPVVYYKVYKPKRGYYEVEVVKLFDNPAETVQYEVTNTHTQVLEQMIKERPELWLWTHKRWKYNREIVASKRKIL